MRKIWLFDVWVLFSEPTNSYYYVSHWPFCCPYQWWGYWWSWNDWGRSLPSSHSCPHASCRRWQRRRTKKYVCSIDTSWHGMKVKTRVGCSKGFCLKPHLSCLRLSTFDTKRTSPSPFGLPYESKHWFCEGKFMDRQENNYDVNRLCF